MKKTAGKRTGEYVSCPLEGCGEEHAIRVDANGHSYVNCGKWKQNIWLTRSSTAENYLGAHKRIAPEVGETPEEREKREEREFNE